MSRRKPYNHQARIARACRSVLCELNPEYAALARARIEVAKRNGAAQMDAFLDVKEIA